MTQTAVPLSLRNTPGDGEFLMDFPFCCTANISCTLSGLVEHLHPLDSEKQKRGLPPAGDCVGQSCKPNMPWCMEPSFPGLPLWPQCGGFMAPCPRCCFCFCCINSCSRAEGPGCIMELDQIDFRLSMRTAEESSMGGPWPVQGPLGVLAWCQLLSEFDVAER